MSARIAIGVGCRAGCSADAIEKLVEQALASAKVEQGSGEAVGLFTICDKRQEAGLIQAAARLRLPLTLLSREDLLAQAPFIQTHSAQAERLFGVPSVAEAAALAGAGAGAVLVVPRLAAQGATCAVAAGQSARFDAVEPSIAPALAEAPDQPA